MRLVKAERKGFNSIFDISHTLPVAQYAENKQALSSLLISVKAIHLSTFEQSLHFHLIKIKGGKNCFFHVKWKYTNSSMQVLWNITREKSKGIYIYIILFSTIFRIGCEFGRILQYHSGCLFISVKPYTPLFSPLLFSLLPGLKINYQTILPATAHSLQHIIINAQLLDGNGIKCVNCN